MKVDRWQWLGRVMLDAELPHSAKIVAFWMREHADAAGEAYPSVATLATLTGLSTRSVELARKALVEEGWLEVVRRFAQHSTATYQLCIPEAKRISPLHTPIAAARTVYGMPPRAKENSPLEYARGEAGFAQGRKNLLPGAKKPAARGESGFTQTPYRTPEENTGREHRPRRRSANGADAATLAAFEAWWPRYPRHVAKQAALEAFAKALKVASRDQLIAGADRYAAARRGEDPRYTAHPTTWLNQGRWLDVDSQPFAGRRPRSGGVVEALLRYGTEDDR